MPLAAPASAGSHQFPVGTSRLPHRNPAVYGSGGLGVGWCANEPRIRHVFVTYSSRIHSFIISIQSQVFKLKLEFKSDIWSVKSLGDFCACDDSCPMLSSCLRFSHCMPPRESSSGWSDSLQSFDRPRFFPYFFANLTRFEADQVTIHLWPPGPCRKGRPWNGDLLCHGIAMVPCCDQLRWQNELTRSIQEDL